jgi:hypothetical protein
MILITIDLPAPLSPRSATTSPAARISKLGSVSVSTAPNRFKTASIRRRGTASLGGGHAGASAGIADQAGYGVPYDKKIHLQIRPNRRSAARLRYAFL